MVNDNASPIPSGEYDERISKSIPYYDAFNEQILDILQQRGAMSGEWLDLGCGTGTLALQAHTRFPDFHFVLADPSDHMLKLAQEKLAALAVEWICAGSEQLAVFPDRFQVVTAVQSHHYLRPDERAQVVKKIFASLKEDGIFLAFENVAPEDESLKEFEFRRWARYRVEHGFPAEDVEAFLARCGVNYFPLPVSTHVKLLRDAGFRQIHVFWQSYVQAGIYAIK